MTEELAEYLIALDKYIVQNKNPKINKEESFLLNIEYPMNFKLNLSAPDDLGQKMTVIIKESPKKSLKISLHHQDNHTKNGLLRIDFYSRHMNPVDILPTVPEKFKPFAGLRLDNYNGHIHYVVDGYKSLVWAIPLESDDFSVKKLNKRKDYICTIEAFFNKINLKTPVNYLFQE